MKNKLRPPAVPLITVDPYFCVWSMADKLNDDYTKHWTGKNNGMTGLIMIDGKTWKFMGKTGSPYNPNAAEPQNMEQTDLTVKPLSSIYVFQSGGVRLTVEFTTPLLLDNLDLMSRPVSYMTFKLKSSDKKKHKVKLYFDATGELCVNVPEQKVCWGRKKIEERADAMYMGNEQQKLLNAAGDDLRIDWGYLYLVIPKNMNSRSAIGPYKLREKFASSGILNGADDLNMPRAVKDEMPVMSVVFEAGEIGGSEKTIWLALAYDDIKSVEYFNNQLPGYWYRNYVSFEKMLSAAISEYSAVMKKCGQFDKKMIKDGVKSGGEKYADMLALAYRQAIAAHKLVADKDGSVLFFSKENYSNGCMATVDVSYPSIPLFLLYNPELVKGMLRPIFKYVAGGQWKFDFAPHDLGTYPKANGQVYSANRIEDQMPIEECGNMIIMTAAACFAEKNADFAEQNWQILTKWAQYLKENGFDPGNQLCTDDFACHLAHNTNLSIKAIVGLGCYSKLCAMLGKKEDSKQYLELAKNLAVKWEEKARDSGHYKLTFDGAGTWSMKYNLVWDEIYKLGLFDKDIAKKETSYYIAHQNKYGIPLDSRRAWTKNDWLLWCATMAKSEKDFLALVEPVWNFLNESPSRVPFTDWYDTVSGNQQGFQARSVVGGLFIKMLKEKRK